MRRSMNCDSFDAENLNKAEYFAKRRYQIRNQERLFKID